MYIPNVNHWIDYYDKLGSKGQNPYINQMNNNRKQIGGGSITGTPKSFITPIGPSSKPSSEARVKLNLVSPVQQTDEMAREMVERDSVKKGIKRKSSRFRVSSSKRRRVSKTANKSILSKQKKKEKSKAKKNLKKKSKSKKKSKAGPKKGKKKTQTSFKDIFG